MNIKSTYKILIISLLSIVIFSGSIYCEPSKFNIEELLDENHPLWRTDSDNDGLPDALEILENTNRYEKDSDNDGVDDNLELEHNLNPNNKDSNKDGKNDNIKDDGFDIDKRYIKEVPKMRATVDIDEDILLECCSLVWQNMNDDILGKTVKEIFPDKFHILHDFTVIRYTHGKGLCAIALKHNEDLIVAYQGSKTYRDWLGNFTTQFMPHPQRKKALEFIEPIVNKEDNIYITGHSLGGLLTQYATYYLSELGYTNVKALTFNSAINFNPNHLKGKYGPPILKNEFLGDYLLVYKNIISKILNNEENQTNINSNELTHEEEMNLSKFLNKSLSEEGFIDMNKNIWKSSEFSGGYDDKIENLIIDKDPIHILMNGGYLGKKTIKESNYEIKDVKNDSESLSKAHGLDNFR